MYSKQRNNFLAGIILIILILSSCSTETEGIREFETNGGIFIINEGNYTYSNSSLSFYTEDSMEIQNDIFYDANGFPCGDAFQSMTIIDSTAYLCISNSGKILIMNANTFRHTGTIGDLGSPRYMCQIDEETAWVSDLYNPFLTVVDLQKQEASGQILLGNSSEKFVKNESFVFVNSWSFNNQIYVLSPSGGFLVDSIQVTKQPNSMVLDKNDKLWVLSDGGYEGSPYGQENAALTRINSNSLEIEKVFTFPDLQNSPVDLSINSTADTLFFLNGGWASSGSVDGGVYRMSIDADDLPGEAFIPEGSNSFYALGIDPVGSEIYCSDALNYFQNGIVYRFSPQGQPVDSFKCGITPGEFVFKENSVAY